MRNNINKKALYLVKTTQKTFNKIAKEFSTSRQKKDKFLENFFNFITPKGKILDAGCGNGRSLIYLKQKGFFNNPNNSYLGIDYSERLLSEARKLQKKLKVEKIKFKKGNLLNLKANQKIDYIICLGVLHHFPHSLQLKVLRNFYKMLDKKGVLCGYVWNPIYKIIKKWEKIGEKSYFKFWKNKRNLPIFYYIFTLKELKYILKKAKFKIIKIKKDKTSDNPVKQNLVFWAQK